MASAHLADELGEGLILVIRPAVAAGRLEVGDDDGAGVGVIMERLDLPVLRIGGIRCEAVLCAVKGNPLIIGEEMGPSFAGALSAVVRHGDGRNMGKTKVIHWALALAILLACLGRPLPEGILR